MNRRDDTPEILFLAFWFCILLADELVYEIDNLVSVARDRGRHEVAALLKKALAQAIQEGEDGRG